MIQCRTAEECVQIPLDELLARQRGETPRKKELIIPTLIFGFGHRARHGKDTVANFIKETFSDQYDIRIYSFARELKEEVNKNAAASGGMKNLFVEGLRAPLGGYYQTNGNILPLPEWVQYEETPDMTDPLCPLGKQRTLLQWWGTEYRRSIEPNYWVDRLKERLAKEKPEIALVPDMRFPNEWAFVKEYGDTIKVHNPRVPIPREAHISETALAHIPDAEWGSVIYNDSTLEQLKQQSVYVFDELMNELKMKE